MTPLEKILDAESVATHDGRFHSDEVFSIAALKMANPDVRVLRTRDLKAMAECDLRFDVGRKYCPGTGDYDHHQKGFDEKRDNGIVYSSFGLVWKELGDYLCGCMEAARIVDRNLVQKIDAGDNGMRTFERVGPAGPYILNQVIGTYLPDGFDDAVDLAQHMLSSEISKARQKADDERSMCAALDTYHNKDYVVLERDMDWKPFMRHTDKSFVLVPREERVSVYCVEEPWGFKVNKVPFPADICGLEDDELVRATGIDGALFCHRQAFTASGRDVESGIALAEYAIARYRHAYRQHLRKAALRVKYAVKDAVLKLVL